MRPMQGLTDRQQQVLHYIRQSINESLDVGRPAKSLLRPSTPIPTCGAVLTGSTLDT